MLDRLREGSSYAGLAAAATAILPTFGVAQPLIAAIASVLGAVAFFLKDKK